MAVSGSPTHRVRTALGQASLRRQVGGRSGFTLVDLLVSLVVIAVLISLLLPHLKGVRESARQVACRSNMRQFGIGVAMYAEANGDLVPPSVFARRGPTGAYVSADSSLIRLGDGRPEWMDRWDGLGVLYVEQYLPAPKLYYCPSHGGQYRFDRYEPRWAGSESGEIVGNYQYRAAGPMGDSPSTGEPPLTPFLSQMSPTAALAADGLTTAAGFNHPVGANILRASLAATWFDDSGGTLPSASTLTAGGVPVESIWRRLDREAW